MAQNKRSFNKHPEELEEERFFSNTNDFGFRRLPWKSKRRGQQTYDGNGKKFAVKNKNKVYRDWFPVFISKEELEESSISLDDARQAFHSMIQKMASEKRSIEHA